jgi:hypothetical protein
MSYSINNIYHGAFPVDVAVRRAMIEDVEARNKALRVAQEAKAKEQARLKAQAYNPWPTAEEALSTWDDCDKYPVDYVGEWLKNAEEAKKENEEPEQAERLPLAERIRGGDEEEEYEDEDDKPMPPLMEHNPIIIRDDEEEEEAQPPVEAGEGWGPSVPEDEDLRWVEVVARGKVAVYLNDVLIFTSDINEHREIVKEVLKQMEDNDLYLRPAKCEFEKTETEYLGVVIKDGQICMVSQL